MYSRENQNGVRPANGNGRAFRDITNSRRDENNGVKRGDVQVKKRNALVVKENPAVFVPKQQSTVPVNENEAVLPVRQPILPVGGHAEQAPIPNRASSYQYSGHVDDIDERDAEDPLCATEYVQDMYNHFRENESNTSVRPIYMEKQTHKRKDALNSCRLVGRSTFEVQISS